jgi:hypothetical protein
VGLNNVCDETLTWLEQGGVAEQMLMPGTLRDGDYQAGIVQGRALTEHAPVTYFSSGNKNIKKYPMMRRMLYEAPAIETPWVIWFDDDTHIEPGSAWWSKLEAMSASPEHCYIGETWFIHYRKRQWELMLDRPWYKGVAPEFIGGRPAVRFHTGGFVAVRTPVLRELDWPDDTLVHNGGDFLLSEAIRQQGWPRTAIPTKKMGIRVNDSKRRGYSEKPRGL